MADGGGRIQIDTRELSPTEFSEIGSSVKKSGVFVFKPNVEKLTEEEKKVIEGYGNTSDFGKGKKSKAQVFRHVLYRVYEQDKEGFKTQEEHYNHYMDTIISHFKNKLEKPLTSN